MILKTFFHKILIDAISDFPVIYLLLLRAIFYPGTDFFYFIARVNLSRESKLIVHRPLACITLKKIVEITTAKGK